MNSITAKMNYVESLNEFLKPMQDFNDIKYVRTHTGAEYIRITDTIGGFAYLDVTGDGLDRILDNIAQIIRHGVPSNVVHDRTVLRMIAPLFRS